MSEYQKVCAVSDCVKNSGVAALINGEQIAIFYIGGQTYAMSNYDPVGKAYVMSRGMTGDKSGHLVVAAPLYKQEYSLTTGICVTDETLTIPVYPSKIEDDAVWVKI